MKLNRMLSIVCMLILCLTLCTPAWADDGGTLSEAHDLGSNGTAQGTLTTNDRADYYSYTVFPGSSVELKIKFTSNIHSKIIIKDIYKKEMFSSDQSVL
ncbi:MAG: hypothetical protein PUK54_02625 [Firmicutes bacterium]|nr:hypothetical protein [Bacillota bacterium]MDY5857062.1 hypothetical protein [Anaerovoracaceae bacterium]